jgi:transcriptional regulator with XRE-family HTH domain
VTATEALVKAIHILCEKKGISVNKLASLSGLTQSTIDSILKGKSKNPRLETIRKIAAGFDMPFDEFWLLLRRLQQSPSPLESTLTQRIQGLRVARNLSFADVASALELDELTYRYYEDGIFEMKLPILIQLADFFNVSLDYLVGRSDDPTPPRKE